jgi:hypothetical protein
MSRRSSGTFCLLCMALLLALAAGALAARQDTPDSTPKGNPTVEPADVNSVDKLKGTKHKYGSSREHPEDYDYREGVVGLGDCLSHNHISHTLGILRSPLIGLLASAKVGALSQLLSCTVLYSGTQIVRLIILGLFSSSSDGSLCTDSFQFWQSILFALHIRDISEWLAYRSSCTAAIESCILQSDQYYH